MVRARPFLGRLLLERDVGGPPVSQPVAVVAIGRWRIV